MRLPKAIVSVVTIAHDIITSDVSPVMLKAAADELETQARKIREHIRANKPA